MFPVNTYFRLDLTKPGLLYSLPLSTHINVFWKYVFAIYHCIILFLDPCKEKVCEFFSKCIAKADNTAACACPVCEENEGYSPVCGSDAKTYASECRLQMTSCKEKRVLRITKRTACGMDTLFLRAVKMRPNLPKSKLERKRNEAHPFGS